MRVHGADDKLAQYRPLRTGYLAEEEEEVVSHKVVASQALHVVLSLLSTIAPASHDKQFALKYGSFHIGHPEEMSMAWQKGLSRLTCLKLTLPETAPGPLERLNSGALRRGDLKRFIAAAHNVQQLELTTKCYGYQHSGFPIEDMFQRGSTWPNLKILKLCKMSWNKAYMRKFFKFHGGALEKFYFESMRDRYRPTDGLNPDIRFWSAVQPLLVTLQDFVWTSEIIASSETESDSRWITHWPSIIPQERALRYLMCAKKTNKLGLEDDVSHHSGYDWESVTWTGLKNDASAAQTRYSIVRNDVAGRYGGRNYI